MLITCVIRHYKQTILERASMNPTTLLVALRYLSVIFLVPHFIEQSGKLLCFPVLSLVSQHSPQMGHKQWKCGAEQLLSLNNPQTIPWCTTSTQVKSAAVVTKTFMREYILSYNSNQELTGIAVRLRKMLGLWFCFFILQSSQKNSEAALPKNQASYFPCLAKIH